MRAKKAVWVLAVSTLLLEGCALDAIHYYAMRSYHEGANQRLAEESGWVDLDGSYGTSGVSVSLSKDYSWRRVTGGVPPKAFLACRPVGAGHSACILIMELRLRAEVSGREEFLAASEQQLRASEKSMRASGKLREFTIHEADGRWKNCLSRNLVSVEPDGDRSLLLESTACLCMHPAVRNTFVRVDYLERHPVDVNASGFPERAKALLERVSFEGV